MNKFTYFENDETYGYKKGNMFIQSYTVEENIFYRKIIITYYLLLKKWKMRFLIMSKLTLILENLD